MQTAGAWKRNRPVPVAGGHGSGAWMRTLPSRRRPWLSSSCRRRSVGATGGRPGAACTPSTNGSNVCSRFEHTLLSTNSRRVSNSSLGVILNTRLALFEVSVKSGLPGAITLEPPLPIQLGRKAAGQGNLVGEAGFEPATPWPPAKCAAGLRYSPNQGSILTISDGEGAHRAGHRMTIHLHGRGCSGDRDPGPPPLGKGGSPGGDS